jgi:hypothetical protein
MNEQDDRGARERGIDELTVPGIILAVADHRRRIARMLDRLDCDRRAIVEGAVQALEDGSLDAATMLMQFHERAATRSRDDGALT